MEFLPVFSGQSSQLNNEKVFVPRGMGCQWHTVYRLIGAMEPPSVYLKLARHAKGNLNLIQAKKHSEISALSSSSTGKKKVDNGDIIAFSTLYLFNQ